jgi:transcriptional regulator with PAS, ATPase and Fis domain
VREFKNCIERIFNIITCNTILVEHLPPYIKKNRSNESSLVNNITSPDTYELTLEETLSKAECRAIKAALKRNQQQRAQTAEELGISKTTLWRKMKKHDLV